VFIICALWRNKCMACLILLAGLIFGVVGWATTAYSALTGTTIFLVSLLSIWPARITWQEKKSGLLSSQKSHILSIACLAVWAIYVIAVQAAGVSGNMGYFIGLIFIWGTT
jgi:hypothetical protein